MRTNLRASTLTPTTHEGGTASRQTPLVELTRAVSNCLLFEHTFYESGNDIADRIATLCDQVSLEDIAALALKARTDLHLRHVPLFLLLQMVRVNTATKAKSPLVAPTIAAVIQRPDEMSELLALYWKGGKRPLAAALKRGLALAFPKFSAYQLAKWNKDSVVKLRDVLFLTYPKSKDAEQGETWKQLVEGALAPPDTWEVALSGGADKKETFERLLCEGKLGYMALLMNLRNMAQANVRPELVDTSLRDGAAKSKALPFRFLTASKHAPQYAGALSDAMIAAVTERIAGSTMVVVDVSGSMDGHLSAKSEATRLDAASSLAVLFREMAPQCRVFTFSAGLVEVPNWRGLPLIQGIDRSQPHSGTYLAQALNLLQAHVPAMDRIVVITDEQTHDGIIPGWGTHNYLINVGAYRHGLDISGGWTRIDGWSDRVVEWMRMEEA